MQKYCLCQQVSRKWEILDENLGLLFVAKSTNHILIPAGKVEVLLSSIYI